MKRLLISVTVVLGLVAAGAGLRAQISSETAIRRMAQALVPGTGERKISIGHSDFRFFPRLALEFQDLSIQSASGDVALTVDRARADLDILPLFIGQTTISRIILQTPHLRLKSALTLEGLLPDRSLMAGLPPASVIVHTGDLTLTDPGSGRSETISDIEATLRWPRALGNLSLDAAGTWRSSPLSLLVQGLSPPRLASGDMGDLDVNLKIAGLEAGFSGRALLSDRLLLDGRMTADIDDPRQTAHDLGIAIGVGNAALPPLPSIAIDGHMRTQGWMAALNSARLRIGDAAADGFLSVQLDTLRPQLRGTLAFGTIDAASVADPGGLATGWLDWMPDLDALRLLDLDLRFSVARGALGDLRATNMAASLLVSNGQIHADIGDAQIFGGNGSVILRGGIEGQNLAINGRFGLAGASLPSLRPFVPIAILPQIGGLLTLSADFQTRGATLRTLFAGLRGAAQADMPQFTLEHQATPTLTIASAGSEVARTVASRLLVTPIASDLKASVRFRGPDLALDAIGLHFGDIGAELSGKLSLATKAISLIGSVRLPHRDDSLAQAPATPLAADLSLAGTLDAAALAVRDAPSVAPAATP
jgi:hypothetical protein